MSEWLECDARRLEALALANPHVGLKVTAESDGSCWFVLPWELIEIAKTWTVRGYKLVVDWECEGGPSIYLDALVG